uniref:cyclic AMP-dependent transcription factor ATF-3-like n=1 Tax=Myxine glutinosa TaxID=7769 RepID=UPI00358F41D1
MMIQPPRSLPFCDLVGLGMWTSPGVSSPSGEPAPLGKAASVCYSPVSPGAAPTFSSGADTNVSSDEEERKRRRRERNKIAAAKCRSKRKERSQSLLEESAMLESRNAELKARFEAMRLERQRLVELLNTRRPSIIVQAPGSNKPCGSPEQRACSQQ